MSGKDLQASFGVMVMHFDTQNINITSAISTHSRHVRLSVRTASPATLNLHQNQCRPKSGYNGKPPLYNLCAIHRAPLVDEPRWIRGTTKDNTGRPSFAPTEFRDGHDLPLSIFDLRCCIHAGHVPLLRLRGAAPLPESPALPGRPATRRLSCALGAATCIRSVSSTHGRPDDFAPGAAAVGRRIPQPPWILSSCEACRASLTCLRSPERVLSTRPDRRIAGGPPHPLSESPKLARLRRRCAYILCWTGNTLALHNPAGPLPFLPCSVPRRG
jgi:hypothetical protein